MDDKKSWKRLSPQFTDPAIGLVRECVAMLRSRGLKTDTVLHDLPPLLGLTGRRVRTLFHVDGFPVVLRNEWLSLRYRVGLLFLNEAQRLRTLADKYEARGEELVAEQLELPWGTRCTKTVLQRRFA